MSKLWVVCMCVCVRLLAQIIQAHLRMGKIIRTKKGLGYYLSVMIKSEGCVFLYLSWKEIIKNGKNWPPAFGPNLENQSQNFTAQGNVIIKSLSRCYRAFCRILHAPQAEEKFTSEETEMKDGEKVSACLTKWVPVGCCEYVKQ